MLRKKIIVLILSICIIISILIAITFINNSKKNKYFNVNLLKADLLIISESYLEADNLLFNTLKYVDSPLEYKQLLKRSYQTQNFSNLSVISGKAYNKYPNDENILSIYIYSLLKTDKIIKAQNIVNNLKENNLPDKLLIETGIKSGETSGFDNIYYQVLSENKIYSFNKLFQITKDNKLLLNSALLYMQNGEYHKADEILSSIESKIMNNSKLFFLGKYYSSKFDEALNLFLLKDFGFSTEEIYLIKIDLNLKMSRYSNALTNITNFIKLYPEYSVLPYINLICLSSFIDVPNIEYYVNLSTNYYSENKELLLILIDYFTLNNNENNAIELAAKYLENNIDDIEIQIKLKQLNGTGNPEKFTNSLYELVDQNKDNLNYSRYLAWSLFKNNNIPDLEIYLERYGNNTDIPWVLFFQALISIKNGDKNPAIEKFQNAFDLENNWESLYNIGILSYYSHDYQIAIEYLQNSENFIPFTSESLQTKSIIRTTLASILYDMKNYNNSYREIQNALDLDNGNLKASLLLKKLESTKY